MAYIGDPIRRYTAIPLSNPVPGHEQEPRVAPSVQPEQLPHSPNPTPAKPEKVQ